MPYRLFDPDETLDYSCDWTAFLTDGDGTPDSIATSAWSVFPVGPSLSGATEAGGVATVFISDGQPGQIYRLTNRISTAAGRVAERSWTLRCESR